jgi:anaerobic magnesium-protoporphyrin IX monomethyl ester cyclase
MIERERPAVLGVAIHAIDKFAGIPLWKYSLAFAYLEAYLSKFPEYQKLDFETLDYYQNESVDTIAAEVRHRRPAMVLFSVYVWNYALYRELARRIKADDPGVLIVLGGPEVSDDTEEFLRDNPGFDVIVTGEGEHTFHELVRRWLDGQDFSTVRGLTYRGSTGPVVNPPANPAILADVNVIPSPLRPHIIDAEKIRGSFAALETQRGCNFSCGFCRYRKIGQGARFFDLDRVFEDIDFLKEAGMRHLYIMDPTFNNDIERAKKILRHIIAADMNLVINAEMVPEFFEEELLKLALQAGIVNIEVGIQSINTPTLKTMMRPRSARKLDARIAMATDIRVGDKKFNVIPQIIYGLPSEGLDGFLQSFDYIYGLDVEEVAVYHLLLLRDTQFYRDRVRHGFVFEAEPPHRLLSSNDWAAEPLLLAGKLAAAAMSTQYMLRSFILAHCRREQISPSQFFLGRVGIDQLPSELAFAFPIYRSEHAKLCRQVVDRIGAVLLDSQDCEELAGVLRQTKRMFAVRASMVEGHALAAA